MQVSPSLRGFLFFFPPFQLAWGLDVSCLWALEKPWVLLIGSKAHALASEVALVLSIHLPVQEAWVPSLARRLPWRR